MKKKLTGLAKYRANKKKKGLADIYDVLKLRKNKNGNMTKKDGTTFIPTGVNR